MTDWQGGASPARVAVAVNPTPFLLQYPLSAGGQYETRVRSLMLALGAWTDVDGLVLGSRFALQPENLSAYELIVIPGGMGVGLSAGMADGLRQYVRGGGKLLVMATPLSTARPDLTEPHDLTRQLCGLEIVQEQLPGYVQLGGASGSAASGKVWADHAVQVRPVGAEVVLRRQGGGEPVLLSQGNVWFSAVDCGRESDQVLAAILPRICRPPVTLADNRGLRNPGRRLQRRPAVPVAVGAGPGPAVRGCRAVGARRARLLREGYRHRPGIVPADAVATTRRRAHRH